MPASVLFVPQNGKTDTDDFDALKYKKILNTTQDAKFASWSLNMPVKASPIEYSVPQNIQSRSNYRGGKLGGVFGKDTRVKVPAADFASGGKYRAICKLYLHFEHQKVGSWATGTGWLINPTTIATAGHCVFDWDYSWGHLTSAKVYIGYNGEENITEPSVEVRHGTRVVVPAPFIEANNVDTKDVAFIRLEKAFNDFEVLSYASTPETGAKQTLSVTGYPDDLDHGEHMYTASDQVTWDLRTADGLLKYKIPTYEGESGSPVIRTSDSTAIGVHILNGNYASVIGNLGNRFEQLTQTLNTLSGNLTSRAPGFTTLKGGKVPVSGFAFVTIPPPAPVEESEDPPIDPIDPIDPIVNGNGHLSDPEEPDVLQTRYFTTFPDALDSIPRLVGDPEKFDPPKDQDFVKTVYFVNMPPGGVSPDDKDTLKKIQQNVLDFQCWFSHRANLSVAAQIKAKKLKPDDFVAQGSYRAMVMDALLKTKANWLNTGTDQSTDNRIKVKKAEFHTGILKAALMGLECPPSIFGSLEKLLDSIGNGILSVGSENSSTAQQFWVLLTYYNYFPETGNFQVLMRTIGFKSTDETKKYMAGKSSITTVDFQCKFASTQWEWNDQLYSKISAEVNKKAIEEGKKLVNDDTVITVELPEADDK